MSCGIGVLMIGFGCFFVLIVVVLLCFVSILIVVAIRKYCIERKEADNDHSCYCFDAFYAHRNMSI